MRVAVLDDYQGVALTSADWSGITSRAEVTVYSNHLHDEGPLIERLKDAEIVVCMRERTALTRSLLSKLPNLKLIVTTGLGNAAIDTPAARELGITVCGTNGLGQPTAELTWGLILGALRRIPQEHQAIKEGRWQTTLGEGLHGKTLGVIGLGKLGGQVATVGKAFGMNVVAWSQNLTKERTDELGVTLASSKDELLRQADIVSIHLVLSDRTRGLVGAEDFKKMKPSAYLVNTSRGPIVDEQALADALRDRTIQGAAIDVFSVEPLPADSPYRTLDNIVLTPHIGYVTKETYEIFYGGVVEDIEAYLDGKPPVREIVAGGHRP